MQALKIFCAVTFILMVCCSTTMGTDVDKIAVVDFKKIMENSKAGRSAMLQLKKQKEMMDSDIQKKREELKDMAQRMKAERFVMEDQKYKEREREFAEQYKGLQRLELRSRRNMKKLETMLINPIKAEVVALAQEIAKTKGYHMVLDIMVVVYAPFSEDISDEIIQKYNAKFTRQMDKDMDQDKTQG